jgi:hypothetical protein
LNADPAYWAANVAPLDDATLLRFIDAVEARRDKYQVALAAALAEGRRRNLLPNEKDPAVTPGPVAGRRKT